MKKKISFPMAITIIVICAILSGVLIFYKTCNRCEVPDEKAFLKENEEAEEVLLKDEVTGWNVYKNLKYGFEFRYPSDFFWEVAGFEPTIMPIECEYANFSEGCPYIKVKDSKTEKEQALKWIGFEVEQVTINDIPYCFWNFSESGAGSYYVNYYYSTIKDKECFVVRLVIRYSNCAKFLPEEKEYEECEYRNNVTIPDTFNEVLSTFKFID